MEVEFLPFFFFVPPDLTEDDAGEWTEATEAASSVETVLLRSRAREATLLPPPLSERRSAEERAVRVAGYCGMTDDSSRGGNWVIRKEKNGEGCLCWMENGRKP